MLKILWLHFSIIPILQSHSFERYLLFSGIILHLEKNVNDIPDSTWCVIFHVRTAAVMFQLLVDFVPKLFFAGNNQKWCFEW